MTMDQEVLAALQRIPLLAAVAAGERSTVERLGGLTNRNYKITTLGDRPGDSLCHAHPRREDRRLHQPRRRGP